MGRVKRYPGIAGQGAADSMRGGTGPIEMHQPLDHGEAIWIMQDNARISQSAAPRPEYIRDILPAVSGSPVERGREANERCGDAHGSHRECPI